MKTFLKVFFFNVAIIAFYLYVGNSIPQQRKDPPRDIALSAEMSQKDFVKAGEEIIGGKGGCAVCHGSERCPDFAGVGARAETRIKEDGYKGTASNGAEYLVESLQQPGVYVVDGFQPIMAPLGRQLNDLEMVAVVSYLQSLGGEVTVDGNTRFPKYRGAAAAAPAPAATAAAAVETGKSVEELLQQYQCNTCHNFDQPGPKLGPSLWDIGARQSVEYIRESILLPDVKLAEGYPPKLMKGTLDGIGFYQKVSLQDLNALVDHLASLKGER